MNSSAATTTIGTSLLRPDGPIMPTSIRDIISGGGHGGGGRGPPPGGPPSRGPPPAIEFEAQIHKLEAMQATFSSNEDQFFLITMSLIIFCNIVQKMDAAQQAMMDQIKGFEEWKTYTEQNINEFFLITMAVVIFLMQAGFAFLEAGAVRSKNTTNILIKNALDSFFAGVSYWICGYAFAFGDGNSFIGYKYFAHNDMPDSLYAHWFFQFVFAATAATIVSGAVAERCDFFAYITYSCILTGFIYPVVTHWAWSGEGWMAVGIDYHDMNGQNFTVAYTDFAGSGVVHVLGGIAAFVGALLMGPRLGRFDKVTGAPVEIKGHSVPLASLGGFILVFGFFAFNGSSQGSISGEGDGAAVATAVKNTVLSASGGAFTTLLMNKTKYFGDKKWSYLTTLNGCLTGMVAICAGCDQFYSYAAFVTGILGGLAYMSFAWLVLKLKVDDPLDATAVHFGGGVVGVIMVAFFSVENGIFYQRDLASAYFLAWQLAGLSAIIGWTFVLCFIMFGVLKKIGILRVPVEIEMRGLDIPKHGEPAYPIEAYGHGWGEKGDVIIDLVKQSSEPVISTTDFEVTVGERDNVSATGVETPELHHANGRNANGRNGHVNRSYIRTDIPTSPLSEQNHRL